MSLTATSAVRHPLISSERQQVGGLGVVLEHWGNVGSEEGAPLPESPTWLPEGPCLSWSTGESQGCRPAGVR